ncbi:hypothetical protein HanPI659440_Chr03g0123441 [Helianthus annuus]|nr:hypothetical protein HanPI659440_Chr03g0123441 [Helianthus annuus]
MIFFNLACGDVDVSGILHLGMIHRNLLTGFGFYEPYWLVAFANACRISIWCSHLDFSKRLRVCLAKVAGGCKLLADGWKPVAVSCSW